MHISDGPSARHKLEPSIASGDAPAAVALHVRELIERLSAETRPNVLDLTAGALSFIPENIAAPKIVGLGRDGSALAANPMLTEHHVQDIAHDVRLAFDDHSFDIVIGTFTMDHLTRPAELFNEVCRVLAPGGLFLAIYSRDLVPRRFISTWKAPGDDERLLSTLEAFVRSDLFESPRVFVAGHTPHAIGRAAIAPVYVVYADTRGRNGKRRRAARTEPAQADVSRAEIDERKQWVRHTLRCPYCDEKLEKWMVPDTPFNEWPNEFFYVCFNDNCSYFVNGWELVGALGNVGSYRLMYDPDHDVCRAAPVIGSSATAKG
jgi:SAM-dependent methyltransferase